MGTPDRPAEFNLNSVKVEAKKFPPFRFFYGPDNKRFEMTHRELLDQIPIMEALERGGEQVATLVAVRNALGDKQWPELRRLGLVGKRLEVLSEEYNKHCGAELGESDGSTDS